MQREMDDAVYEQLEARCERGNVAYDEGRLQDALAEFLAALELIPKPVEEWEASTLVLGSIGDCLFLLKDYARARDYLTWVMRCPEALGNPFLHLRLGQVQYELGNEERARDELARAVMGGGTELFASEEPKYLAYIRRFMRGL